MRHACDIGDITDRQTTFTTADGKLLALRFTVARSNIYTMKCCAILRILPEGPVLEYLGIANRLSNDILMSRPVYYRRDAWEKYALEIHEAAGVECPEAHRMKE